MRQLVEDGQELHHSIEAILHTAERVELLIYPVIFNDTDGDLYLINTKDKNIDKGVKLATQETASKVKYANTTKRYVLFQKEENLFLYDAKKKGETKKIVNNIAGTNYYFSDDDDYVIALDKSNNLRVYDFKDTEKIDGNVNRIIAISGDYILYEKENNIYLRAIKPSKDKKYKITDSSVLSIRFSEDSKSVVYINSENELHRYTIKKDNDEKVAKSVTNFYCDEKSCEKVVYVQDNNGKYLYLNNGKKDIEMASEIFAVLAADVDKEQVVYSKTNGNKFNIYYQKGKKSEAKVDEGLAGIKSVKLVDNEIYYLTNPRSSEAGAGVKLFMDARKRLRWRCNCQMYARRAERISMSATSRHHTHRGMRSTTSASGWLQRLPGSVSCSSMQ